MPTEIPAVWTTRKPGPNKFAPIDPEYLAQMALPQPLSEGFQLHCSGPPPPGPTYTSEKIHPYQQTRRIDSSGMSVIQLSDPSDLEASKHAESEKNRLRLCAGKLGWRWLVCGILCLCLSIALCIGIPVYLHHRHRADAKHSQQQHPQRTHTLTAPALLTISPSSHTCNNATHPSSPPSPPSQNPRSPPQHPSVLIPRIQKLAPLLPHRDTRTRNLQSAVYSVLYAGSIPALVGELKLRKG